MGNTFSQREVALFPEGAHEGWPCPLIQRSLRRAFWKQARRQLGQICPFDIWFKRTPTKSRPSGLSGDDPQNLRRLCNRATPGGSLFARLWIAFDRRLHVKPSSRHLSRMTSPHPSSGHDATPRPCQFAVLLRSPFDLSNGRI